MPAKSDHLGHLCPTCQQAMILPVKPATWPFCSARCRGADLYRWLSEGYVIPGPPVSETPADPADPV